MDLNVKQNAELILFYNEGIILYIFHDFFKMNSINLPSYSQFDKLAMLKTSCNFLSVTVP